MAFDAPLPDTGDLRRDLISMFSGLARSLQSAPWDRLLPSVIGAAAHDRRTRELHGELTRQRRDAAATVIDRALKRGELPPTRLRATWSSSSPVLSTIAS